jgi:hypothetical protein
MARKLVLAVLTVAVATGGFFVAVESSAGAGAGAPKASAPPGLDHFLCYDAAAVANGTKPVFKVPTGVTLLNQFSASEFAPKFAAIDLHCNPATKTVPGASFPALSPSWHLMCYAITGTQKPNTHLVNVSNQFGQENLVTGPPNQFCLPSLKSTATRPKFTPPGPNEIMPDHFTCYPVKVSGPVGFKPPSPIRVLDQFTKKPVVVKVGSPTELCVPTQKSIKKVVAARITNPTAHLLCFTVSQTPVISPIWDQNQFGTGQLNVTNTRTLCLPSAKKLIR